MPHHDDITVGKIQHFCDTINHGITECDDSIDTAQADAADQIR